MYQKALLHSIRQVSLLINLDLIICIVSITTATVSSSAKYLVPIAGNYVVAPVADKWGYKDR